MPKKKTARDRGQVIRLSTEVFNYLRTKRKRKSRESFDSVLRRILGLNARTGKMQPLEVFWLLRKPMLGIFKKRSDARGQAILRAVRAKTKKTETPVKVRESV